MPDTDKAVEKELTRLRRLPENRVCPNCLNEDRLGFTAICMVFKTFICSECKSAHAGFSHRTKSASQSVWKMEEVQVLDERNGGGNRVAEKRWLANVPESERPGPDSSLEARKKFIERAYIQELWINTEPDNGDIGEQIAGIPSGGEQITSIPSGNSSRPEDGIEYSRERARTFGGERRKHHHRRHAERDRARTNWTDCGEFQSGAEQSYHGYGGAAWPAVDGDGNDFTFDQGGDFQASPVPSYALDGRASPEVTMAIPCGAGAYDNAREGLGRSRPLPPDSWMFQSTTSTSSGYSTAYLESTMQAHHATVQRDANLGVVKPAPRNVAPDAPALRSSPHVMMIDPTNPWADAVPASASSSRDTGLEWQLPKWSSSPGLSPSTSSATTSFPTSPHTTRSLPFNLSLYPFHIAVDPTNPWADAVNGPQTRGSGRGHNASHQPVRAF